MTAKEAVECAVILLSDAIASMQDRDETDTESYREVKDARDMLERVDTSRETTPTFTVFFPKDWECLDLCEEHIDHWLWRENPFTRWSVLVSPIDEADQRQCEVLL